MVGVALHLRCQKQSPWSSASEKGIDSLAVWLILTLGHPDHFTYFIYSSTLITKPGLWDKSVLHVRKNTNLNFKPCLPKS